MTGMLPFDGETMGEVLVKQVTQLPPPPRGLNPSIPPSVEQIVLRCLAKTLDARFPTMIALREALLDPEAYLRDVAADGARALARARRGEGRREDGDGVRGAAAAGTQTAMQRTAGAAAAAGAGADRCRATRRAQTMIATARLDAARAVAAGAAGARDGRARRSRR